MARSSREPAGVLEMFCILIWVVVKYVYTHEKLHQAVDLRFEHFLAHIIPQLVYKN